MGHPTSERPHPPTPPYQRKGAKSPGPEGGGRKGKKGGRFQPRRIAMYVLGMLGATAYWQDGATEGASTRDRRCCGGNFLEPQPVAQEIDVYMVDDELDLPKVEEIVLSSHEVPYSLADTGAATGVVGIEWLERVAQELSRYDLAPVRTPATQKFRGLGGARRGATERWTLPIGIGGKHAIQQ